MPKLDLGKFSEKSSRKNVSIACTSNCDCHFNT